MELNQYQQPFYHLPIQAIRIGEGIIGTLPGEFFSETGLHLKKQTSAKYYFTITLANAMIGYVPPASQFDLGGYETWLCSGSHLAADSEAKIAGTVASLIKTFQ